MQFAHKFRLDPDRPESGPAPGKLAPSGNPPHPSQKTYRGASLIRNTHPPRTTMGLKALGYCRVLRGGWFL